MKGLAELPLIGIIGTLTIVIGVVAPPLIIQSSMYKNLDYTYNFENGQNTLLSLMSSATNKVDNYQGIGLNYVNNNPQDPSLKNNLDKILGSNYCISIRSDGAQDSPALISSATSVKTCSSYSTQFNTVFVLPYNKNKPLVQIIGIGIQ